MKLNCLIFFIYGKEPLFIRFSFLFFFFVYFQYNTSERNQTEIVRINNKKQKWLKAGWIGTSRHRCSVIASWGVQVHFCNLEVVEQKQNCQKQSQSQRQWLVGPNVELLRNGPMHVPHKCDMVRQKNCWCCSSESSSKGHNMLRSTMWYIQVWSYVYIVSPDTYLPVDRYSGTSKILG